MRQFLLERGLAWLTALLLALLLTAGPSQGPVSATTYTVRTDRPRIWLTPAIVASLRAEAAAASPRWLALKHACDASASPSWDVGVISYALAYQVSGDPAEADKAIALMLKYAAQGVNAISGDDGYAARSALPDMAIGYDWCYDRLTPDQRTQCRTAMEQMADWVWPDTNPARAGAWGLWPGNNYYHGFMMTWLIGLALAGDSPKAPGYIDLARQKFLDQVLPYLETTGAGGYMVEGTNYGIGSIFHIFWYLAAHASATGEDLFHTPGFDWPQQAVLAQLYLTTPSGDRVYPGGDQARVSSAPLSDYNRCPMLMAQAYLDPTTAGYAKWWLDHIQPNQDQWGFTQWEEFLWYPEQQAGIDYTQALPTGYLAAGAGWMTSRSGWETNATQVCMQVGPTLEDHQDRSQNGFMIFKGDWLAAAAKVASQSGLEQGSPDNNTLTIGGQGQIFGQKSAHVVHFEDTPSYAYFAGEAGGAYNQPDQPKLLNSFRRELLFLKPGRVLVFDRVDAVNATLVKAWHLNTLKEPTVGAHSYQTTVGGSTLFGTSLLPLGATIAKQGVHAGRDNALSSWRIDIAAPPGNKIDQFLNVLEAAPDSQTDPTTVLPLQTGRGSLAGAQIGNQAVIFDGSPGLSISYPMNAIPTLEHFVLDQAPGKWYQVTAQTAAGSVLQQQRVQASKQGVLTFAVTALGGRTVTITPADGQAGTAAARLKAGGPAAHPASVARPAPVPRSGSSPRSVQPAGRRRISRSPTAAAGL